MSDPHSADFIKDFVKGSKYLQLSVFLQFCIWQIKMVYPLSNSMKVTFIYADYCYIYYHQSYQYVIYSFIKILSKFKIRELEK